MKSMLSFLKFTGACLLIFALSFLAGTKVLKAEHILQDAPHGAHILYLNHGILIA